MHVSRRAFTLIETLIAMAIALVLLGASLFASRQISASALQLHDRAEMGAVADEVIAELRLAQLQNPSQPLATTLGIGAATQQTGGFYTSSAGTPVALSWGSTSQLAPIISANSPVTQTGLAAGSFTDLYAMANDLGDLRLGSQLTLDLSTPRQAGTKIDADAAADSGHWSVYAVTTTLVRASDTTSGWGFNNDAGAAVSTNKSQLQTGSYLVQVTVSNYHNPASKLVRQAYLTDWTS